MSESEEAARKEAKVAAERTWRQFERLGDRLDELQRDYDDQEALKALQSVEDLLTDLDDVLAEAQEAVRDE